MTDIAVAVIDQQDYEAGRYCVMAYLDTVEEALRDDRYEVVKLDYGSPGKGIHRILVVVKEVRS